MVNADGKVVFGAGLLNTDPQMDALHSIVRLVLNCNHPLPDSFVEDPYLREMCEYVFEAGRDAGIRDDVRATCPKLTIKALQLHATAELDAQQATLLHYNKQLWETAGGNPCTFTMSDICHPRGRATIPVYWQLFSLPAVSASHARLSRRCCSSE